jgi:pyruvate dehydrogenase E2 component (dihydrolipoamide acetyltransferase)
VPSSAAGTIKEMKVNEGDRVSEGALILIVEEDGAGGSEQKPEVEADVDAKRDTQATGRGDGSGGQPAAQQPPASSQGTPAQVAPQQAGVASVAPGIVTDKGFGRAHASPSIRAFARSLGVDLSHINGSGRKGRILREDVTGYFRQTAAPAEAKASPAQGGMGIPPIPAVDFSKFGPIENVEMSRIKKISGPALHRSWLNIPHVTNDDEADITELDQYRKELDSEAKKDGYRVTLLSFIIKASVSALKKHWELNSSIHPDGDKLIRKNYYNIGFAADTPNGLVVPVIKDADRKGIVDVSKELGSLSEAARDGKLKPADMQGASFTISSLGGIGGTGFTPIVNAPEVAILGLTRSKMAPVWNGTEFEPRNMLPMSLSYDHRAIDGALAARFLVTLKYLLGDVRRLML